MKVILWWKFASDESWNREVIAVIRSDGWRRFACGDVFKPNPTNPLLQLQSKLISTLPSHNMTWFTTSHTLDPSLTYNDLTSHTCKRKLLYNLYIYDDFLVPWHWKLKPASITCHCIAWMPIFLNENVVKHFSFSSFVNWSAFAYFGTNSKVFLLHWHWKILFERINSNKCKSHLPF